MALDALSLLLSVLFANTLHTTHLPSRWQEEAQVASAQAQAAAWANTGRGPGGCGALQVRLVGFRFVNRFQSVLSGWLNSGTLLAWLFEGVSCGALQVSAGCVLLFPSVFIRLMKRGLV